MTNEVEVYKPKNDVRVVTATSIFDGHDAAINIMRRILQDTGVEVIHLGHNRSVQEIVEAAIEEDVQGVAVSSYPGGHVEFFKYIIDLLKEKGAPHIKVFGGGGGVIVPEEIKDLEAYGVAKIYSPEDGTRLGLQGMINHMVAALDFSTVKNHKFELNDLNPANPFLVAKVISAAEQAKSQENGDFKAIRDQLSQKLKSRKVPVIGITGTGGAGKSSLTDELILRMLHDITDVQIAIISCDPSRRKTGGALLGDRIRMNAIGNAQIYFRSLATRRSGTELPAVLPDAIAVAQAAGYDLIIAETAGIGQGDSSIADLVDLPIYVMTSEFGAASQLEKIDMLDFADLVVINKFEKRGADDAVRDVRKQVQRNQKLWDTDPEEMPVFGTIASKFNDDGVTAVYHAIIDKIAEKTGVKFKTSLPRPQTRISSSKTIIIPQERIRYLSEISDTVRNYHRQTGDQAQNLRKVWHLKETVAAIGANDETEDSHILNSKLKDEIEKAEATLKKKTIDSIAEWKQIKDDYSKDELVYQVRDREISVPLFTESLSHTRIPKIALPRFEDPAEIYRWMREENVSGRFPFTAGVFPLKRADEEPTRMFAGEGDPARTNRRFKLLSADYEAKRLSTAYDSVTLYGCDPDIRPDIYGKIGTSGVSICTLDDVKVVYDGFDLCAPSTSVSMTINGPAPVILAFFLNTAIDQQVELHLRRTGGWEEAHKTIARRFADLDIPRPVYRGQDRPEGDRALGLGTLGISGDQLLDAETYGRIREATVKVVRGTVQADILKEDQAQNTCIFSTEFALRMMGDIQQYFIDHSVRNYYSVSISGYHIAEAGANPISQLAFTLSNGFTYVEYYLSRGMEIDKFAHNLSFFFSNGIDPEYAVIGRVARRIWSTAMKHKYGAGSRSQKLKYHIQTSGRSLHAQEIDFNDIRTTLQALYAHYDNCNSLHTNSYDEAITTPTEESVRRAVAIQMIIDQELGLAKNQNPIQGAFIIEELTDLVEQAVLEEFDRISRRGGVLGAMETQYQRGKIQEESMYYEHLKHSGELPIMGVNTFLRPANLAQGEARPTELIRSTPAEKEQQLNTVIAFRDANAAHGDDALIRLRTTAREKGNLFAELMETVKYCSLGQISHSLFGVGGRYRRNM
jgi:methylmalonyl-CoA mutase